MTRYSIPQDCIFCGRTGHVTLTARTPGGRVVMHWYCCECERDWPVKQYEQVDERRRGPADRRRRTRADRRNRST